MLIVDRNATLSAKPPKIKVSISHLRCLSLIGQVDRLVRCRCTNGFNLTLEMLIVDRERVADRSIGHRRRFNLTLEMLIVDRKRAEDAQGSK